MNGIPTPKVVNDFVVAQGIDIEQVTALALFVRPNDGLYLNVELKANKELEEYFHATVPGGDPDILFDGVAEPTEEKANVPVVKDVANVPKPPVSK